MSTPSETKIRCRQIGEQDVEAVIGLLMRGFSGRSRQFWQRGMARQAARPVLPNCPRFGYLLESGGTPVGVVLLLFTAIETDAKPSTRCNVSSWYVEPAFRSHASPLIFMALKHKHVTYTNISPARHTWPIVEAQGFTRYCSGQLFAVPALSRRSERVRLHQVTVGSVADATATVPEYELLETHAGYGCVSLICRAEDGDHPFVFLPFRIRRGRIPLPCMHLIYCRDVAEFVRFAGPIGRFFLKRRMPWVILDSNGPVEGLVGLYREARGRKYFKGPQPPRLGDLAYTEMVLFGP